jgi:hypothetical protein
MKNKRKIAEKLEHFLEEEFTKNIPVAVLADKTVVYKNYKIKKTNDGMFSLAFGGRAFETIDKFNLKACALLAAKKHDRCHLAGYNEVVDLDRKYWNNFTDTKYYEARMKTSKDLERYCILSSRLDLSRSRALEYKNKIQGMFKMSFV